jgi:hypothetical protein
MSFFNGGKNKEGRNPPTGPTDKSQYSLFRNKSAGDTAPAAEQERSLRIVRGKGAVDSEQPEISSSSASSGQEVTPAATPSPADGTTQTPSQRTGGLFSRGKSTPPAAAETVPVEPPSDAAPVLATSEQASALPAAAEPRATGFLARLKGQPTPPQQKEPTLAPLASEAPSAAPQKEAVEDVSPTLEESVPVEASSVQPSRKGAFLGLGKKSEKPADKPEKTPKKAKEPKKEKAAPKAKKPKTGSSRNVHIYVQLDGNQREFFWSLKPDAIEEVGREDVQSAASFSREDIAVRTAKTLTFKAAQDVALQEIGEPVHLVNRSKDLGYVYATREERPLTAGFRLLPGQQALDRIVKRKKLLQGKPLIAGFTFTNAEGQVAVAILYHVSPEGDVSRPQVTLNPDRMEFVLNEFAKQRKLNRKDSEVVLFSNADFLAEVGALQAYPVEPVWRGIPVSRVWRFAAVVSAIGAFGSCGWTVLGYVQQQQVSAKIEQLTQKQDEAKEKASRLIGKSLYSFSHSLSIDQDRVFDVAQQLWVPGTQLTVEAKPDRATYRILVPVVTNKTFENRPSVDATPPKSQVDVALQIKAPPGCHKDTASVSGNMNEIEISVVCENRRSPLSSFRND